MNLSAVILARGESRRMGQDKAWLEIGGQSLLAVSAEISAIERGVREALGREPLSFTEFAHTQARTRWDNSRAGFHERIVTLGSRTNHLEIL
jgi:CTP:molybdopterin cytidylyltransferase MocA